MVNREAPETKDDAEYGLQLVCRLAGFRAVSLASPRVQRHVFNLDYTLEDVCDLLSLLEERHFDHSERYHERGPWHDVYFLEHPVEGYPDEKLYIKFRISRDCIQLDLCSFHPEGWQ